MALFTEGGFTRQEYQEWIRKPLKERRAICNVNSEAKRKSYRLEDVAVFDCETDPFDNTLKSWVKPFCGVLYRDDAEPVVIWDADFDSWCDRVISAIGQLPRRFMIYAHNGGRFDYMFLLHKLRGAIKFKGRGIMSVRVGPHELRDSFHILPTKLAAFRKDEFDYDKMLPENREASREEIIQYCVNDCKYLLTVIKSFIKEYGFKLSIGQAAMQELKKHYTWERIGKHSDEYLRQYFFGGRVDCLQGAGRFCGDFRIYDVNSMYPAVMASHLHPTGSEFEIRSKASPTENTFFVLLECENDNALVQRNIITNISGHTIQEVINAAQTTASTRNGVFFTTIHEFRIAEKHGLIKGINILACVDFEQRSNFAEFIRPIYERRLHWKREEDRLEREAPFSEAHFEAVKWSMFLKLLMNNAYGKFAQNPERFAESYLLDLDAKPPVDDNGTWVLEESFVPYSGIGGYALWSRPAPNLRFNNVATGASITGAARAVLLAQIVLAKNPIYCDTDSLICEGLHPDTELDVAKLGAWKYEGSYDDIIIVGKKTYAVRNTDTGKEKVRSKGAFNLTWANFEGIITGQSIIQTKKGPIVGVISKAKGPTINKDGSQTYQERTVKITAARKRIS